MMKHEFDELVGMETAPEAYERIEFVYMNSNEFDTKQQIADFYKENDMNGIEKKCKELIEKEMRTEEFESFIHDLAYFCRDLVAPIKQHLAETALEIFKDKTITKMLSEYRVRDMKELKEIEDSFGYCIRNEVKPLWGNHCLTHSGSYKDVIADLTYNKWWHEHAKEFD